MVVPDVGHGVVVEIAALSIVVFEVVRFRFF